LGALTKDLYGGTTKTQIIKVVSVDVYEIIFYQILQFQPSDPLLKQNLPHDLLYAILLPAIALYIILSVFSTTFAAGHKKIKDLIIVGALGVIIINGWYPTIAHMFVPIFIIALILGTVKVFKRMVLSKETETGLLKLGAKGTGKVGEWFYKKYKKYDRKFLEQLVIETLRLENEIKAIDAVIAKLKEKEGEMRDWSIAIINEFMRRREKIEEKLNRNYQLRIELGISDKDLEDVKKEIMEKYESIIKQDTKRELENIAGNAAGDRGRRIVRQLKLTDF
jgi:hypothetical protein